MIGTCLKSQDSSLQVGVHGWWGEHGYRISYSKSMEDHGYFLTLLHSCYLCVLKNIASTSTDEELASPKTFGTYGPHFLYYNKLLKL